MPEKSMKKSLNKLTPLEIELLLIWSAQFVSLLLWFFPILNVYPTFRSWTVFDDCEWFETNGDGNVYDTSPLPLTSPTAFTFPVVLASHPSQSPYHSYCSFLILGIREQLAKVFMPNHSDNSH